MEVNNICSVLINTCDKYEDAWHPFFELVKKYWVDCPYKFYLNTEKKDCIHDGIELTVLNHSINSQNCEMTWGERIKACLQNIDSPFVILFLEDFFLQDNVDQKEIEACLEMMSQDENLIAVYFKQIEGYTDNYSANSKYYMMTENKRYKLNLQAGLWRKEELQKLIYDTDSPWSLEEEGQSRIANSEMKFLCSKNGTHTNYEHCVFPYLTDRKLGYGIWSGKWLWNNDRLFEKNGIKINEISMDRFTRFDMLQYYFKRLKEKLNISK